jgi:hypothetical protein
MRSRLRTEWYSDRLATRYISFFLSLLQLMTLMKYSTERKKFSMKQQDLTNEIMVFQHSCKIQVAYIRSGICTAVDMIFYFYVDGNIFATHSLCPMAPVCTFFTFLRGEIFYFHGFLFFTVLVAFSLFVRRLFCFMFCPVGFVGDILFKIGRACRLPRISETNLFRSFSLYSRIFFLVSALFIPLFTGCMIFQHACPFILIGDMMYGIVVPLAVSIFSVIVFLSLFISRFFCRFICPLGLIMGHNGQDRQPLSPDTDCRSDLQRGFFMRKMH